MNNNLTYLDDILEKLCKANGIGFSGDVKNILLDEIQSFTDDARIFSDSSVYGLLKGLHNINVMLACHIDEIGFVVSDIEKNGFIKFKQVGNCDGRIMPGQEVVILGKKEIRGYVGAKPPHLMKKEEADRVMRIDELFIDTGLNPELLKKFLDIGDYICFAGYYNKLQSDFRSAKALDNRASIACAILVMRELYKLGSPVNLHFVATNQEEFSGLGARIHSYRLNPDYCIVIDVTHGEYPGLSEGEYFNLTKGPVIARGATIPQRLYRLLNESARSNEIPYQIKPVPSYTGTDAEAIAFNKEGIPTCVLGIPLRYMHTPVEVVCLKDIERTARLVIEFLKRL